MSQLSLNNAVTTSLTAEPVLLNLSNLYVSKCFEEAAGDVSPTVKAVYSSLLQLLRADAAQVRKRAVVVLRTAWEAEADPEASGGGQMN